MGEIETLLFQPNFSQVKRTGVPSISDPVREGSLGTGQRFHYQLYTFNLKYNTRSRKHRYLSNSADKGTKHALSNLACPQGSVPLPRARSPCQKVGLRNRKSSLLLKKLFEFLIQVCQISGISQWQEVLQIRVKRLHVSIRCFNLEFT